MTKSVILLGYLSRAKRDMEVSLKEREIENQISNIHKEIDHYLTAGDRESIMKLIVILDRTWDVLLRKDDGLRYTYLFKNIWIDETARGEHSIFTDVSGVGDILKKCRLIRHAFFRLENDFPPELCIEAMQIISGYQLSKTAFHQLLDLTEDREKIINRINEISLNYAERV